MTERLSQVQVRAATRRPILLTFFVFVALAILVTIYLHLRPREIQPVGLDTREIVRTLVVAGQVRPQSRAELGTSIPGVVREVMGMEGGRFEAGDILVRLDNQDARATVEQAASRLVEVEATSRDQIARAALEVEQSGRDLDRVRSVFSAGGLTQQLVEQAAQRAADAVSRLEALQAGDDASGLSASVTGARAAADAARARLSLATLTAPYSGIVLERWVEPGDAVQAGQRLLTVASDGPIEVIAFPSEENLARLRIGAPATVSADAYPDDSFAAFVALIAPSVDPTQGTVEVRLSIDDPPAYLLPGMTLSVNIEVDRKSAVQVLPTSAVRGLGTGEPWVAVIREGRVERQSVELGIQGDVFVEVVSGVVAGDEVVPSSEDVEVGDRVRSRSDS